MEQIASLLFGGIMIVGIAGIAVEAVQARFRQPAAPGPLAGLTLGDVILIVAYAAPILLGFAATLHSVLT